MNDKELYLYCIVPNNSMTELIKLLGHTNLSVISYESISAVASKRDHTDFRKLGTEPLAELLVHHQEIIESVMSLGFSVVIPIMLGTFAKNKTEVREILKKSFTMVKNIMKNISHTVEMDVVAVLSNLNKTLSVIADDQRVLEMKSIIKQKKEIDQTDQIAVGRLVKAILDEKKDAYALQISDALHPLCQDIRQHELLNDLMVSNSALLVNRGRLAALEQLVSSLDAEFSGNLNFKIVGPLPCYSFYTIEVRHLIYKEVEEAKLALELSDMTSKRSFKKAYMTKVKQYHPDVSEDSSHSEMFDRVERAYKTMLAYVSFLDNLPDDEQFSLLPDAVSENALKVLIRE